ncbi:MAG: YkvA family protein [Chloroflexota bacterium]|nr:YkvA family protein [Chloroflexota bacterium]
MNSKKSSHDLNFFKLLSSWLVNLPTDTKMLIEMVRDDELDIKARTLAVGTVVYILSTIDIIPDNIPVLGFIDDVTILRLSLMLILEIDPNRATHYREKYENTFVDWYEQLEVAKEILGSLYSWLRALAEKLPNRRFHGKSTEEVVKSEQLQEELFDEAMEYVSKVDVDPKTVEDALLSASPTRITELLANGLEEEQKRQIDEQEKQETTPRLTQALSGFKKLLGQGSDF